ncbi:MAG: hypothetical protein JO327_07165, partial [Nitrososphaeraceae archaeon]|nr:hypothetical protein [Nitrososphaeraceae archaeon]
NAIQSVVKRPFVFTSATPYFAAGLANTSGIPSFSITTNYSNTPIQYFDIQKCGKRYS